ncbi:M20 family metallopeptidase [Ramlibacter sp. AW1]|uniref:Probable succinyl-diaminopimelate desuccinylase n=1 Tax=Ramlibacter aurantiacus TaxID=2801330 RepID=A0A936ZTG7_9BURK|nr:M20 family metallopeptidase [Ramlibacter aurantiacus]MBL0420855.1 M20 family metallopeptidase [Ramlibacter aurantiacus]
MTDPIDLTRRLIAFDTVNPPGRERECALALADLLQQAGFDTRLVPLGQDRANLIATKGRPGKRGPLVFTGHIDVVPLGTREWSHAPFAGEIVDGKIYGRGSSDMKGGIAAIVCAAVAEAHRMVDGMQVALIITAGEETGCDGAEAIIAAGLQFKAGALVVAEPTANMPYVGHKGALWLRGIARGVTAHGSMPEAGDNAVYKAARATTRLSCFHFDVDPHPTLGAPTLNVGTFHGGLNINSVPDRAVIEIDLRTIPGMDHADLRQAITVHMQEEMEVETAIDLPGVWTSPQQPWVERTIAIASQETGEPFQLRTATYFSDASVLVPALGGAPTLILGPGEPGQAHQTDEWCAVERIQQATRIYRRMIAEWAEQDQENTQ